jgi:hypothetical protein
MGTMMTSKEIALITGTPKQNLRVFFGRFFIGHLATNPGMDGYLGLMPPNSRRSMTTALKPQIGGHILRGV